MRERQAEHTRQALAGGMALLSASHAVLPGPGTRPGPTGGLSGGAGTGLDGSRGGGNSFGQPGMATQRQAGLTAARAPLYTPQERIRRDQTVWTLVQGILAPVQFLIFLVSLALVVRTLLTGEGFFWANLSVVVKTIALYTIMITGSIWEKVVFGKWLFARPFFWEDVFSMLVLALHTAYLYMISQGLGTHSQLMWLALAAYAAYLVNAGQFLLKLRAARLDHSARLAAAGAVA